MPPSRNDGQKKIFLPGRIFSTGGTTAEAAMGAVTKVHPANAVAAIQPAGFDVLSEVAQSDTPFLACCCGCTEKALAEYATRAKQAIEYFIIIVNSVVAVVLLSIQ